MWSSKHMEPDLVSGDEEMIEANAETDFYKSEVSEREGKGKWITVPKIQTEESLEELCSYSNCSWLILY